MAIEKPNYTVIGTVGDIEYRQYAPYIVAETRIPGDWSANSAGNEGFRRLVKYISGNNDARGKIATGEELHNQSITGTEFIGKVVGEATVGDHAAVIPQVRGSAYITGHQRFVFDPHDPLVHGLR